MAATLYDLVVPQTADDFKRTRFGLLQLRGFPITAWEPGGVALTLIETEAEIDADQSRLVPVIAAGAFLGTASGDWLDLKGESDYDEARKPAVATVGRVTVKDVAHVGPVDLQAGDLLVVGPDGQEYASTEAKTVPLDGQVSIEVRAIELGSQGNVGVNTITAFGTDQVGLAVSNVAVAGGTWITTLGADAEGDDAYAERCRLKWSALGTGANAEAYAYHALASDGGIRRVRTLEHVPEDGQVTLYVAGSTGPATDSAYAACVARVEAKRPLAVRVFVHNADPFPVTVAGTVQVKASFLATARAAVQKNLLAYVGRLALEDTFLVAQAIEEIMAPDGVVNVALSEPTADVTPPLGACLVLENLLAYVAV